MNTFYLHQFTFSWFLGKKTVWEIIPQLFAMWSGHSSVPRYGVLGLMKTSSTRAVILGLRLIFMQTLVPFREDVVLAPASFLHTQRSASPPSTRSPPPWFSPPCSPPHLLLLRHDSFLYLMTVNFLVLWASLLHGPFLNYNWSKRPFSGDFIYFFFLLFF